MSSGLELLKQAMANRQRAETNAPADKMPKSKATPAVRQVASSDAGKTTRAYIIENKPKNKVVREYFESIVEKVVDFVDNEDE
jgi:hypothetical protein